PRPARRGVRRRDPPPRQGRAARLGARRRGGAGGGALVIKFLPLIWANLARNKLRTTLTAGAIALAVALVCLLLTMPGGLDRILNEIASNNRIVVLNKAGLVYPLPYSYLQKVRAMEGVVEAASWTWFGGAFRVEKGVEFPNFAVEPAVIGVVWEDWGIAPEQLEAFRRYRNAAIVGRG